MSYDLYLHHRGRNDAFISRSELVKALAEDFVVENISEDKNGYVEFFTVKVKRARDKKISYKSWVVTDGIEFNLNDEDNTFWCSVWGIGRGKRVWATFSTVVGAVAEALNFVIYNPQTGTTEHPEMYLQYEELETRSYKKKKLRIKRVLGLVDKIFLVISITGLLIGLWLPSDGLLSDILIYGGVVFMFLTLILKDLIDSF